MAKQSNSHPVAARKPARAKPPALPRPGGKLGVIVDLLARKDGASADELMAGTGWQRHSVLGALSRLRARGFGMRVIADGQGGSRTYQLSVTVLCDDAR
jgi:hypothetical protein